ncbi:polyunsaturated fatty acid 5-lipoxygenase-like [Crassostrea virginica]|uniref:Arachidonate 5-lipoxygenase-like isoform X1 n=1 Tax=Crassostrea virginica TaxID=6565 RepID=A0A8B8DBB7_CRAVI|nr:arachidonate 5-lipoxygenase-like isoform X1 [Crassostrea virginica]XP_022324226.1 arachidonate 5-lipoxygenase-like isoform X4 [Crassostrea virginica]
MDYTVIVKTGDRFLSGTDSTVRIVLHGDSGNSTQPRVLDNVFRDDFEQGAIDKFSIRDEDVGDIAWVEVWRDDFGVAANWFVETIIVERKGKLFHFPFLRWVKAHTNYRIQHLDTSLPQDDKFLEQRNALLEEKRKLYDFSVKGPGLPVQVKAIPDDEQFSFDYKWNIAKRKLKMIADSKLQLLTKGGKWEGIQDLTKVFTSAFGEPLGCKRWSNDIFFGWQRINSMNHSLIELCTEVPKKMGVTDVMLQPFLEGWPLHQVIEAKRLFMVDLEILQGLPCKSEEYVCPVPIALFFVNGDGRLVPIAIQLFQQKADDNPVFLPTDPPYTWMMAKMWYNLADASFHQSITHLGYTHLIMEGVCVAFHRNLSQSHPLFKLLAPHFLYLIAINTRGLELLVAPNGWVDKTMNIGIKGMFDLIARGLNRWRMDVHGTLPEDLKRRGVYCLNGKVLPGYYYRDDALLLYDAIKTYVTKYVNLYYDSQEKIENDWEIQNFGRELTLSREEGGCGLLGVPFEDKFDKPEQLIMVFTSIIYTCSVAHASTNFPQYDEYAFPPNYPASMNGSPPKDKKPLTEEDILATLPDKKTTLDVMTVTKILSDRGTNSLGNFEVQYIFDPDAKQIVQEFRAELQRISETIKRRNESRNPKYEWLDPELVPNSISI